MLGRSPEIRKSTRGTRTPPLTVIARSPCDEAIQGPRAVAPGLLRCARNDDGVEAAIIGHRLSRLRGLSLDCFALLAMTDRALFSDRPIPAKAGVRRRI